MYLKSMEVQGFKSFAHKTKFEFQNGITAIVGPNGSGKSNVSDAVRWVFGEQSAKQLRGSNMQDIIFSGTQTRRPQSFASVSLTLDNTDHSLNMDYEEITVTRKVFRSGESEYLINGNSCRLKDILELFYDTGIGKEGYSVIGQGQVDQIISGKMDDRRELFDEACGIVKFKKRKNAAVKKLEHEQASMVRISDIVSELERQAGPLKRQSETAREYLKLRDELRVYDINAFIHDYSRYNTELKEIKDKLELTRKDLQDKRDEETDLRTTYASLEEEISGLDRDLEDLREKVRQGTEEKTGLEGQINLLSEQIRNRDQDIKRFTDHIRDLDERADENLKRIDELDLRSEENRKEMEALQETYQDKDLQYREQDTKIRLYRQSVEENRQGLIDLLEEKNETSSRLSSLITLIEQIENRIRESRDTLLQLKDTKTSLEEELQKEGDNLKEIEGSLSKGYEENRKTREELEEAEDSYNETQRSIYELNQKYQIAKSRYDTLKAMQEQYEGFNNAVRRIMEIRSRYPEVCGVVSDLIETEKTYQTAIEAALGGNYQNIVVETDETAKALIRYLKENRAGRATFLPLNAVKASGKLSDERILQEEGVLGTADQLVHYDQKYDGVMRFLLQRIVVVKDIDLASKLAAKYRYQIRMVTLEGDIFAIGGSITGGSFKNTNHYLNRSGELKELESSSQDLMNKAREAEMKLNVLKQLRDSLILENDDQTDELTALELKKTESRSRNDFLRSRLSQTNQEIRDHQDRLKDHEMELKSSESEKRSIEEAMENLEDLNRDSDSSKEKITEMLNEAEAVYRDLQEETQSLKLKLSSLSQKADYIQSEKDRLEEDILKMAQDKKRTEESIREASSGITEKEEETQRLKGLYEESTKALEGLEEAYRKLTEEKEGMNSRQKQYFDKREALASVISDLDREEVRLQTREEKNEEKLDSLVNYLWSEYELAPSEAEKFRDDTLDNPTRIRRHAEELKSAIKKLGNVNVNAIEQYAEVSERYEFLTGQYEDLKKAEADLQSIIHDLDEGMRARFSEQFGRISEEYDKVFKELFGGGQGTLELKEGDILEADIQIIAQPPGKKLQNMMQLSGGEKALSAISLIFAIQNLKPSPFCLLDEIEAALDDSNIGRFTRYLRRLTHSTQFIVITHRRGTMAAADTLYGITMQEKGVSTLISVNLVEEELTN